MYATETMKRDNDTCKGENSCRKVDNSPAREVTHFVTITEITHGSSHYETLIHGRLSGRTLLEYKRQFFLKFLYRSLVCYG